MRTQKMNSRFALLRGGQVALALLVVASLVGCATTNVESRLRLAARSRGMQQSQRVAIQPFAGPRGSEASGRLSAAISTVNYHKLVSLGVDQARAQELEKRLASGGGVEESLSAPEGATVIVDGQVQQDNYQKKVEESEQEECVARNKKGCTKKVKVRYYTLTESCTVPMAVRAKSVADGQVFLDKTVQREVEESRSKKGSVPDSQRAMVCDRSFDAAVLLLEQYLTPHYATVKLEFHDVDDAARNTDRATALMAGGASPEAGKLFTSVVEDPGLSNEDRAWARYNLAIYQWTQGEFESCVRQLEQARGVLLGERDVAEMQQSCQEYLE